jgi:hypothetical protein
MPNMTSIWPKNILLQSYLIYIFDDNVCRDKLYGNLNKNGIPLTAPNFFYIKSKFHLLQA